MGHFDWDPDELLNFDYGKSVPDRSSAEKEVRQTADGYRNNQQLGRNQVDDAQLYNALRKESEEQKIREQIDAKMRAQRDAQMRSRQEAREREEREIKQAQLRAYQESERRAQERARAERAAQQEAYEKAQRQAQYEAQQRAQHEAQMRAQYEAQQRAQHESQMRAQYEAQQRAQQEAQMRAQYEAQQRAQQERARQEAQIRAQQEAEQRTQVAQQRTQAEQPNIIDVQREAELLARKEAEAKKQAQIEAYERYRAQSRNEKPVSTSTANNDRNSLKKSKGKASSTTKYTDTLNKVSKVVSVLQIIAVVVFAVSMTIMNVLPFLYLILMYVVLGLLTAILTGQLRKRIVKKWARVVALIVSIVLIFIYSVGTAYALGTLSFLEETTVKNENSVASITKDPFNVVMTGMDVTGTIDTQGRSDVNMIVTVNPQTATILLTSIPRDYEIRMPDKGYATDKLTHTGFYSVETTILAEEDLLDIDANYYVKVNFSTVKNFINAIGGVDVYSEYSFNPVKMKSWTVQEGINHMNGEQALAFARERKAFAAGDNQRIKNQQAVFEALIKKATSSKTMAISYGKVLNQLSDYFEMSFSSKEIRALTKYQIAKNPKWKIYKNTLVGGGALKSTYTGGSQPLYVMEQDPASIAEAKSLINAVLEGKELTKDDNDVVSVVETETDSEE